MVLSGTLREFILADVFQLLTQQKITGKLILNNGRGEGVVIFKDGEIVAAEKGDETLANKLDIYITTVHHQFAAKASELFKRHVGNLHDLTAAIVTSGILGQNDMSLFAETVTTDITCSLFLWSSGSYRFTSLQNVDTLIPDALSIPIENIVMEAMRRVDEWHRMQEYVTDDTIFVKSQKDHTIAKSDVDPLMNPAEYIYTLIDGTSPVTHLVKKSCLTEYNTFEALSSLTQSKKILALSNQISQSVQAALQKKQRESTFVPNSTFFSILTVAGIILIIILAALILKGIILPNTTIRQEFSQSEQRIISAEEKIATAKLYFEAYYGIKAQNLEQLKTFQLITSQDLNYYNKRSRLSTESQIPNTAKKM